MFYSSFLFRAMTLVFPLFSQLLSLPPTSRYIFTTEGHLLPINGKLRRKVWEEEGILDASGQKGGGRGRMLQQPQCQNPGSDSRFEMPLRSGYLRQVLAQFGLALEEEAAGAAKS